MVRALAFQKDWHAKRNADKGSFNINNSNFNKEKIQEWINSHGKIIGEDSLELIPMAGIPIAPSRVARNEKEAIKIAGEIGYPIVMKVESPDVSIRQM